MFLGYEIYFVKISLVCLIVLCDGKVAPEAIFLILNHDPTSPSLSLFSISAFPFGKTKHNNSPLASGQTPKGQSQEINGCSRRGQGQRAEHSAPVFVSEPRPFGPGGHPSMRVDAPHQV